MCKGVWIEAFMQHMMIIRGQRVRWVLWGRKEIKERMVRWEIQERKVTKVTPVNPDKEDSLGKWSVINNFDVYEQS